jgi:hypothetical protein
MQEVVKSDQLFGDVVCPASMFNVVGIIDDPHLYAQQNTCVVLLGTNFCKCSFASIATYSLITFLLSILWSKIQLA